MKRLAAALLVQLIIAGCGGGDDSKKECVPGDASRSDMVCTDAGVWEARKLDAQWPPPGQRCVFNSGLWVTTLTPADVETDINCEETPASSTVFNVPWYLDGAPADGDCDLTLDGCGRVCHLQNADGAGIEETIQAESATRLVGYSTLTPKGARVAACTWTVTLAKL